MSATHQYEFLMLLLVAIAALEVAARRLRLPPAAALIAGGGALAVMPGVPVIAIDPELVLLIFLPPLLMSGGYYTAWTDFRANLGAITALAVGAVAFTTAVVGIAAHALVPGLPWAMCFALGATVSPPDAVAAAAVLKRLSLPARLTATLQGESLLNDASGLVLFRFAVAAALTGTFSAAEAGLNFVVLSAGGVLLGVMVGRVGVALLRRIADAELAILVTLLLPTAAYIGGERAHVSGVLAVVAAGIVVGRHQHSALTAATRIRAQAFWAMLTYLLESLLFVLIGLALNDVLSRLDELARGPHGLWGPVAGVVVATIVARFVWMYANWVLRRVAHASGAVGIATPSLALATVLGWAGMRGVVTLAAALSIPASLPGRDFVLVSAFAVIIVTTLVQGTTLGPLVRVLGITGEKDAAARRIGEAQARVRVAQVQAEALTRLSQSNDGLERHPRLVEQYGRRAQLAMEAAQGDGVEAHRASRVAHHEAVLQAVRAGRTEALKLHATGAIHDETLRSLEWEFDMEQLAAESRL